MFSQCIILLKLLIKIPALVSILISIRICEFHSDLFLQKVSQFMSRAARLNEAFSVVRRVPIVRPLLPATGVNSWPVMTLR